MALFPLFAQLWGARKIQNLAQTLVERTEQDVWELVHARAASMSMAEARGYIRTRARLLVREQAQLVLAGAGAMGRSVQAESESLALDILAHRMIQRLVQRAARPKPQRRAA